MKKKSLKWLQDNKIHFIAWAIFIAYETVVIGLIFNVFGNPITYLLHYAVNVIFFYLWSNLGLPWALAKKRMIFWRIPAVLILGLSLYIILKYLSDIVLISWGIIADEANFGLTYQSVLKSLYRGIYFMGISTTYFLLKARDTERKEKEQFRKLNFDNILKQQEIQRELIKTQNAFLKAQINPHFLFNTLDFVYHSVHTNPDAAADAVIYLSRMMRFAIDANEQGEFIQLGEEIAHVETLMNLYRLRKTDSCMPELRYSKEIGDLYFIPLVILTLAENMIKHGIYGKTEKPAFISIEMQEDTLLIMTKNAIARPLFKPDSGAGLENIKKRLNFVYGENIDFKYFDDTNGQFITTIKIDRKYLNRPVRKENG